MDEAQVAAVFLPLQTAQMTAVAQGKRLVHYTSAEAAFRIITGREVWLRSVHLMNDYSELRHGLTCLQQSWQSEAGAKLRQWLDQSWPGLREELEKTFDGHSNALLETTFIISLSEHEDHEDQFGRLSMWRAYGGRSGVALVLNTAAFLSDTEEMSVFSTPVTYMDVDEYVTWFGKWVDALIEQQAAIASLDQAALLNVLFFAFRMAVLATKHPGFREEKEWRVFHSPVIDGASDWVRIETEVIQGVPQPVVKLQLKDDEARGVTGVSPAGLVNRVVIGPCESPVPIRNALWSAMDSADIEDVATKIIMSFIPLRQR